MIKRIIFIVAMLWSVAYGQSKVFIRGDSIVIQKVGGNGELIVENGTRNVTGGVLTNMGNGRTRFVVPSGGGLSGGNLGSSYRLYSPGSQGIKTLATPNSVKLDSVTANTLTAQLDGDQSAPGPYYNYGTNGSGTKGFYRGAALDTSERQDQYTIVYDDASGMLVFRPPYDTSGTGTISGSGTSGRGAYWNGASSITSSANWTFDGTTHIIANSTTAPSITAGNINLQSLATNNNVFGFNTYFNSGFKATATGRTSGIYAPNGELQFMTSSSNSSAGAAAAWACRIRIAEGGNVAIGPSVGAITPTAYLHLSNGTATAGTAPMKYTSGTLLTTIEAGTREYNNAHYISTNALNRLGLGGVIFSNSTSVSNSTTTVTTLSTYTTKANTLVANEETIFFEYSGTTDGTSNMEIELSFAGTVVGTFPHGSTAATWTVRGKIVRTGSTTATAFATFHTNTTLIPVVTKLTGLTLTGTNVLLLTGESTGGGTDAIIKELAEIGWRPAAAN